jgi:hypothetical protein
MKGMDGVGTVHVGVMIPGLGLGLGQGLGIGPARGSGSSLGPGPGLGKSPDRGERSRMRVLGGRMMSSRRRWVSTGTAVKRVVEEDDDEGGGDGDRGLMDRVNKGSSLEERRSSLDARVERDEVGGSLIAPGHSSSMTLPTSLPLDRLSSSTPQSPSTSSILPTPDPPQRRHLDRLRNPSARVDRYPSNHAPRPIQLYRASRLDELRGLWVEYLNLRKEHPKERPQSPTPNEVQHKEEKQGIRKKMKFLVGRIGRIRRGGKEEEWAVDEEVVRGWEDIGGYYVGRWRRSGDLERDGESSAGVREETRVMVDEGQGLDGFLKLISERLRRVGVDERLIRPFLEALTTRSTAIDDPHSLSPRYHTLSVPLPSFLVTQLTLTKLQTPDAHSRWTKIITRLIDLGAWDSSEQAEIWSALVRGRARWGDEVGLKVMGERFGEVVVRTRVEERRDDEEDAVQGGRGDGGMTSAYGVRSVNRVEGFGSMGLTLTTILMASLPPTSSSTGQLGQSDAPRRTGRLKEPARRLMGRMVRKMVELNSTEWSPAWVGLLSDPRVIGSDARVHITRWVGERRRRLAEEPRVEEVDLRRFTFPKVEVDRWVAKDVKNRLFLPDPIVLPGETVERLVFRKHADLVRMDRGEMPLSMSEALFKSALRDGETRRARKTFLQSNKAALKEAGSRDRVASLARAMAMADLSRNTEIMRRVVDTVEDFARLDSKSSTGDPQHLAWMRSLAWTRLLAAYHEETGVTKRDWLDLCAHLPNEVRSDPGVLTTLMKCYMARQMPDLAWQCWQDLVGMKRIDAAAITLAATFKYDEAGIEAAMSFVDDWTGATVHDQGHDQAPIDAITVNVLLRLAGKARRADSATWLWQNMRTRWQAQPDATSLAYLIDCVSRAAPQTDRPSIHANWAQHPTRLLPSASRPATSHRFKVETTFEWQDVAEIFRDTAVNLYPDLVQVTSPMKEGRVMGAFKELVASGHLPHVETARAHVPRNNTLSQAIPHTRLLSDLSLSALNFDTYIRMLVHRQLYDDAVLALGWMKRLSIYPNRSTLLVVLRELADNGQPKDLRFLKEKTGWSRCQLMAPDEWLRYWLEMWLGPKRTPSDDEVAQSVRQRLAGRSP